jgi:hypothetical protein
MTNSSGKSFDDYFNEFTNKEKKKEKEITPQVNSDVVQSKINDVSVNAEEKIKITEEISEQLKNISRKPKINDDNDKEKGKNINEKM